MYLTVATVNVETLPITSSHVQDSDTTCTAMLQQQLPITKSRVQHAIATTFTNRK